MNMMNNKLENEQQMMIAVNNVCSEFGVKIIQPLLSPSFVEFAKKIDAPLLANMTEFGKSPYLSVEQFENMGYSIILFPVTVLRSMLKAADSSLRELKLKGTQVNLVDKIMKRSEIYEIINYREFVNIELACSCRYPST